MAAVLLGLAACAAPHSRVPGIDPTAAEAEAERQREFAVSEELRQYRRLWGVGLPILKANAEFCEGRIRHTLGFSSYGDDELNRASEDMRAAYRKVADVQPDRRVVLWVDTSGPVAGEIEIGDQVVSYNDVADFSDGFKDRLEKILASGEIVTVTVEGADGEKVIEITPEPLCDYKVQIEPKDGVNAYATGDGIVMTTGMMNFARTDQELALVFGHELAHNTRDHVTAKQANAIGGAIAGAIFTVLTGVDVTQLGAEMGAAAYSQEFEAEADYIGVYHAERAGFDMTDAEHFWRRMATNSPGAIGLAGSTHPSTANRFLAIREAVEEVRRKREAGEPLIPEELSEEERAARFEQPETPDR